MDIHKNIRVLLGLVGGFGLIFLNSPLMQTVQIYFPGLFTQWLFELLSIIGTVYVLWFSLWLIIDACKAIFIRK
jgi:hypothetical protein